MNVRTVRRHVARETGPVLVDLLANNLSRGHRQVAIRRYLMLRACGFHVPDEYRGACEALVSSCPAAKLRRIEDGVRSWIDMLTAPAPDWPRVPDVVVDKFAHLHALARPFRPSRTS